MFVYYPRLNPPSWLFFTIFDFMFFSLFLTFYWFFYVFSYFFTNSFQSNSYPENVFNEKMLFLKNDWFLFLNFFMIFHCLLAFSRFFSENYFSWEKMNFREKWIFEIMCYSLWIFLARFKLALKSFQYVLLVIVDYIGWKIDENIYPGYQKKIFEGKFWLLQ